MKKILLSLLLVTALILSVSGCLAEKTCTVTFDTDGGSAVRSQVVNVGENAIAPTAPVKEGYTFAGWYVGDTAYDFTSAVTENVTLKAKWTLNTYTVTFDADNGTEGTTAPVEHGKTAVAPADPIKAGYTFAGWYLGEAVYDFATAVTGDITLKAVWTVNQYTITFDTDGGSEIAPITSDFGAAVTAPAAPTKEGYTFAGWDKEIPATMPVEGVTVKALWTVNQYTITFDTDGGSEIAPITLDFGAAVTAPTAPTKAGYTFAGWDKEIPATMPIEGITVKALWTVNQYTITFDTDGGSEIDPITLDFGAAVTAPAAPTKTGYTFAGWDKEIPATMPIEGITVKALWTVNQYTITFDTNGGSEIAPITLDFGAAVTAPTAPTKVGHFFAGWNREIPATMPAENVTITASWTVKQYTITFDTDGGSEVAPIKLDFGTAVTAPDAPTKTGYTFAGWEVDIPATMPAENVTIKATWTINQYTITFNTDGGSEVAPITLDFGAAVIAPADPTKTGYTFADWDVAIPATMPAENMTITASWKINQYTITFNTNGGNKIAAITLDFGAAVTAPADPTKAGHTFAGWDVDIPATMPAENMTITASWTINQYTVTFDADNGDPLITVTVNYGEIVNAPADPEKEGYNFAGWYLGDKAFDIESPISESVNLKAHWAINHYTVIINADNGTDIDDNIVEYGTIIANPGTPVKEGYTFKGWFVGENEYDFANPITGNTTIKAVWAINQYTITFDTVGGNTIAAITLDFGADVTAPADPTKTGYTFAGWDVEIPETMPAKNVTITASWTINQYTITFNTVDGSAIDSITLDYGTAIVAPADPTKTGYTFAGWDVAIPATMPAENVTITASWTINQYTITFDTDGGNAIDSITLDYGAAIVAPADPTKEGYTFTGWDVEIPETMPAENVTVKALWTLNTYTVIFNADNGTLNKNVLVNHGATVDAIADPVMEGYIFDGWFIGDTKYDFTTPVTGELTLTAKWTMITYNVTVDTANGAEATTQTVNYGNAAVLPTDLVKPGFKFVGWTLNGEAYDVTAVVTSDITIVAAWEVVLPDLTEIAGTWTGDEMVGYTAYSYEFIIAANGVITASYNNGYTDVVLTINYVLFENNVLTINYDAGSVEGANLVFTLSGDKGSLATQAGVMGTAVTLSKTYTVTFDWGNYKSEVDPTTKTVSSGSTVTAPSKSWTGYEIKAWYLNGEVFDLANTPITSDITLVAEWAPKMLTVTLYGQDGTTVVKTLEVAYNTVFGDLADQLPTEIPTTDGFKFNGKWYTTIKATSPVSATAKITADKEYFPGLIAPMDDIAGTWTGIDSKGNAYTMVVDATNQTVAITTVNGDVTTEYNVASIYYKDFSGTVKLVVRYTTGISTSETTLTLTYTAEGTFTGSNSLVLEKQGQSSYTVTFDSDGGSAVEAQTIAKDATAQEPVAPTKDGYTFAGWYNGEIPYDFATPVTGDITLVAKWEEVVVSAEYIVTFVMTSSASETKTVLAGEYVVAPEKLTKPSSTSLMGWFDEDGNEFDIASTPITSDITLTAKWGYTVTIYNQNKEEVTNFLVEKDTPIPEDKIPEAVVNEGFVFTGTWHKSYTVSAAPVDITAPVSGTTKLYPGVIEESITDLAGTWTGEKANSDGTVNVYTFTIDVAVDENGKVTGVTVVPVVDGVTYEPESVQYNASSSNMQLCIKYYQEGSTSIKQFAINYNATEETVKLASPSIVLTKIVPHTVIFINGTTTVSTQEVLTFQYATAPESLTKPSSTTFMGWFDENGNEFDIASTPITSDITLTAKWGYTVTVYNQNKEEVTNFLVEKGTPIPEDKIPAAVVNEGFVFTGTWHKSYTASAAPVDITAPVSGTTKLYPGVIAESITDLAGTWTGEKANSDGTVNVYTFTIDVAVDENGKVTGVTVVPVVDGVTYEPESVQYNASSSNMQLCIKYYQEGSTSIKQFAINYNATEETVKLASPSIVLKKFGVHTVTFDTDGGNAIEAQTVVDGKAAVAPVVPTKEGYTFAGWYLDGSAYDFETPVTADITLVAKWN
ncbi:MAG: hypothetical protein E7584_02650 [Ruminococcaceae bacterium]|nr:hypothetical protein [Oscillospiraceae bacterium]